MLGKRILLVPVLVLAIALSGCSVIGKATGMVSQEDLEAANAEVGRLQDELNAANSRTTEFEDQADTLQGELVDALAEAKEATAAKDELQSEVEQWEVLRCPDHNWNEFLNVIRVWLPEESVNSANLEWDFQSELTQWYPHPSDWFEGKWATILLWDKAEPQSMVLDIWADCVIINPDWNSTLGR